MEVILKFHPHRHWLSVFHCRHESNRARSFDCSLSQSMWKFACDMKIRHFAVFREYGAQHYGSLNAELARAFRISWLSLFEYARLLRNLTTAKDPIIVGRVGAHSPNSRTEATRRDRRRHGRIRRCPKRGKELFSGPIRSGLSHREH